jgi:hypothetical protein
MHLQDDDLELYLQGHLAANQESTLEAHLAKCEFCKSRLIETARFMKQATGLARKQQHRAASEEWQHDLRVVTNDPASMKILNPFSPVRLDAQVLDVSPDGLKLSAHVSVKPGTLVQIRVKNQIALAEVRYCRHAGTDFDVGVEIFS